MGVMSLDSEWGPIAKTIVECIKTHDKITLSQDEEIDALKEEILQLKNEIKALKEGGK